jgi:hypothetical protein
MAELRSARMDRHHQMSAGVFRERREAMGRMYTRMQGTGKRTIGRRYLEEAISMETGDGSVATCHTEVSRPELVGDGHVGDRMA